MQSFNTAMVRFETVPTEYGIDVHIHVLDGYDTEHVIVIDRKLAAETIRDAANVWLGTNELFEVSKSLEVV